MELRDEFAAAAMNGFVSTMGYGRAYDLELVARHSYEIADTMLRVRDEPHKTMEQIAEEFKRLTRKKNHIADVGKMVYPDGGPMMPFEPPPPAPQLTLTPEEVKAVKRAAATADDYHDDIVAATLRRLLERTA